MTTENKRFHLLGPSCMIKFMLTNAWPQQHKNVTVHMQNNARNKRLGASKVHILPFQNGKLNFKFMIYAETNPQIQQSLWKKNKNIIPSHCFKINQNVSLEFSSLAFMEPIFVLKNDLFGNYVWPKASVFKKIVKIDQSNVNIARFARTVVNCDFFCDFQTQCRLWVQS